VQIADMRYRNLGPTIGRKNQLVVSVLTRPMIMVGASGCRPSIMGHILIGNFHPLLSRVDSSACNIKNVKLQNIHRIAVLRNDQLDLGKLSFAGSAEAL